MSETGNNQDQEHLRLLAVFHFVCAGLAALGACIPIFHLIAGLFMILAPEIFGTTPAEPPRIVGLIFVLVALTVMLAGWVFAGLLAWAGRCLSRRKAYTFCFVMACLAIMFVPLGTILGVFTMIVLMRPTVKPLFERAAPA